MNKCMERLYNGLIKENPTFVLTLGMCPTLAVTTSAQNGLGMGLTTTAVLALSNVFISLLRKVIPDKVRIPAFIVIIASFVTMMELLLEGFLPSLYDSLGIYIPLIVVNCIILGRAESYASKNPMLPSLFDGIGMGLGFTVALTMIGGVREILGAGQIFGVTIMPSGYVPVSIFIMAPGAFFVLAILTAIQNAIKINGEKKGKDMSMIGSGCSRDCMNCGQTDCGSRFYDAGSKVEEKTDPNAEEKTDPKAAETTKAKPDKKNKDDKDNKDNIKTDKANKDDLKADETNKDNVKTDEANKEASNQKGKEE